MHLFHLHEGDLKSMIHTYNFFEDCSFYSDRLLLEQVSLASLRATGGPCFTHRVPGEEGSLGPGKVKTQRAWWG